MDFLKNANWLYIVVMLLGFRSLYEINIAQAMVAIGAMSLYGYSKYLSTIEKPDVSAEIKEELEAIRTNVSNLTLKSMSGMDKTFRR